MDRYRVEPGSKVRLADYPTDDTGDFKSREEAEAKMARDIERLAELQERLYAENTRALLIVLQAMDTGGKDGTVKTVMSGVNPTGCEVTAFKIPSEEEADHDFLWRIYSRLPRRGNIGSGFGPEFAVGAGWRLECAPRPGTGWSGGDHGQPDWEDYR